MKIFIKQVGEEAVSVTAKPSDTSLDLKTQFGLGKGVSLCFRGKAVPNAMSMEEAGVKEGSVLAAFATNKPPKGFETHSQYRAARRLQTGKTLRSTKHHELHKKTQAVIMQEAALLGRKIDDKSQDLSQQVENLGNRLTRQTRPLEAGQDQWIIKLSSLTVANLNDLLGRHGLQTKGTKVYKAVRLSSLDPEVLQAFMEELVNPDRAPTTEDDKPAEEDNKPAEEDEKDKTGKKAKNHKKDKAKETPGANDDAAVDPAATGAEDTPKTAKAAEKLAARTCPWCKRLFTFPSTLIKHQVNCKSNPDIVPKKKGAIVTEPVESAADGAGSSSIGEPPCKAPRVEKIVEEVTEPSTAVGEGVGSSSGSSSYSDSENEQTDMDKGASSGSSSSGSSSSYSDSEDEQQDP